MTWRLCAMSASELRSCTWEPSSNSRQLMNSSPGRVTLTPARSCPRCRNCNPGPESGLRRYKGIHQALFPYRAVAGSTRAVPERSRSVLESRRHYERSRRGIWQPVISRTSSIMPNRHHRFVFRHERIDGNHGPVSGVGKELFDQSQVNDLGIPNRHPSLDPFSFCLGSYPLA
jgi:hypothetical protein